MLTGAQYSATIMIINGTPTDISYHFLCDLDRSEVVISYVILRHVDENITFTLQNRWDSIVQTSG